MDCSPITLVVHTELVRWSWIVFLVGGVYFAWTAAREGNLPLGFAIAAVMLALAWWSSPRRGGRSLRHQEVLAMAEAQRPVVVYWRPGCPFCERLRRSLGDQRRRAHWVNIWQDEDAAAYVRSVNDGNETVPTVVLDGIPLTNPHPRTVRARLVPDGN